MTAGKDQSRSDSARQRKGKLSSRHSEEDILRAVDDDDEGPDRPQITQASKERLMELREKLHEAELRAKGFCSECRRFWEKCTRPTRREFEMSMIMHIVGFVILALFAIVVRIAYTIVSRILLLPRANAA